MALMLLLALAFACFISAPVMSGEHPWDADDSGTDGNPEDTLIVITEIDTAGTDSANDGGSGSIDWSTQLAVWINGVAQLF
jgi:hypothetical protein